MILGRGETNGREMLILGLSRVNVERLVSGQPIRIRKESHGDGVPQGWEILIIYGNTELELASHLRSVGLLKPETQIKVDPRLGD